MEHYALEFKPEYPSAEDDKYAKYLYDNGDFFLCYRYISQVTSMDFIRSRKYSDVRYG